jgi:hypothetical protein
MERIRGLKQLVQDTVEHGSRAVERIQIEAAKRPFDLLEQIPPIKAPVQDAREIHDTIVSAVHRVIRLTNRIAGETVDRIILYIEPGSPDKGAASRVPTIPPPPPPQATGRR